MGQRGKHSLQSQHSRAAISGDEADFLADAPVHKSDGVLLFDLGAIADAQPAMDAEGGLFLKAVPVRAILLGQFQQLKGIRGMGP